MILEDGPLLLRIHMCIRPPPRTNHTIGVGGCATCATFRVRAKNRALRALQFGSMQGDTGQRLRDAMAQLDLMDLDFQYEGEMNIDAALDPELRARVMPQNRMDGIANV